MGYRADRTVARASPNDGRIKAAGVFIEVGDEPGELLVGRATVPLIALADQSEALERDAAKVHLFYRDRQSMDRHSVREHQPDRPDVHRERHRTGALGSSPASELNDLAVKLGNPWLAELPLQHDERCVLGSARGFAHLAHVRDVQIDQLSKGGRPARPGRCRDLAAIDAAFQLPRPASSRRTKVWLTYRPLRRTWARQEPDGSLVRVAIFLCDLGALRGRRSE